MTTINTGLQASSGLIKRARFGARQSAALGDGATTQPQKRHRGHLFRNFFGIEGMRFLYKHVGARLLTAQMRESFESSKAGNVILHGNPLALAAGSAALGL